jgi:hypothetical protein
MKIQRLLASLFISIGLTASALSAKTLYVKASNTSPAAPFSSWATASPNLQDALAASASGDQIWVATGAYYPDQGSAQTPADRDATFQLKNGVAIYGGFNGDETDLDAANSAANLTILSGDIDKDGTPDSNSYSVLTALEVDATSILHGFTIQHGNANDSSEEITEATVGGALLCFQASPSIANCKFIGNKAVYGAGVYCEDGAPTFTNCSFRANEATVGAGAFTQGSAAPSFINCMFQGNKANEHGGAAYFFESSPTLTNCSFQGNQAVEFGGAIVNDNSESSLTNCIVWNNQAAGVTNTEPASIHNLENSFLTFSHCLIDNYSKVDLDTFGESPDTNLEKDKDPLFIALSNPADAPSLLGDLRLSNGSDAIDAGSNLANESVKDLAGKTRIIDATIDLGAHESGIDPVTVPPVITLNGENLITLLFGSPWNDPGATVTDNLDADPTVTIGGDTVDISIPGASYVVTYDATDDDGNQAVQLTRTVIIAEPTTPPVIELNGDATMTITLEEAKTWIDLDPGVSATDATGAEIGDYYYTPESDSLDSPIPGTSYTLIYETVDIYGNVSEQVTRTVTIAAQPIEPVLTAQPDRFNIKSASSNVSLDVLKNDTITAGLHSQLIIADAGGEGSKGGTLTTDGKTISYTPPSDFKGSEFFFYEVSYTANGINLVNGAQVTVSVLPEGTTLTAAIETFIDEITRTMKNNPNGLRLLTLFYKYIGEIMAILIANPDIGGEVANLLASSLHNQRSLASLSVEIGNGGQLLNTFNALQEGAAAFITGSGSNVSITQDTVDQIQTLKALVYAAASDELKADIDAELFDLQNRVGLSYDQFFDSFGADPANLSVPISFHPTEADNQFSVKTVNLEGVSYILWKSPSLNPPEWSIAEDATITQLSREVIIADPNPVTSNVFYRLQSKATPSAGN